MGQPPFTYTLDHRGDQVCLALTGELDFATAGQLGVAVDEAAALRPGTLLIDVGGLRFIDSHCIGVLVRTRNATVADGRRFALVDAHGMVSQVLRFMGLLDLLAPRPSSAGPHTE